MINLRIVWKDNDIKATEQLPSSKIEHQISHNFALRLKHFIHRQSSTLFALCGNIIRYTRDAQRQPGIYTTKTASFGRRDGTHQGK